MKKIFSKEAVIALITITSLIVFYAGVNYLKGINIFKPSNHYYVLMPSVSELQVSSPIYVDGFKVGVVNSIDYDFANPAPEHILVTISLDKKMKLQTGSFVELKSGLTSGAYLDLALNKYVSTYLTVGDTINGVVNPNIMNKLVSEMLPQVESLLPQLDSILSGVNHLLNHPALNQSLDNISKTTASLNKSSIELNKLLANDVPEIVADLKNISSNFTVVSENLKGLDLETPVSSFTSTVENLNKVAQQINDTDNSLGLLLNDSSLYHNLDSTAKNAADLLQDLKENPKRYVHFSLF
ncbi:MlaD family protein [Bacteroidales bacterium OttesenSCG-928-I14]|nr:MlaD family protein [Bacteroidales bacterium OttesenSCG-928-I14]